MLTSPKVDPKLASKLSRPMLDALGIVARAGGECGTTVSNHPPGYVGGITAYALERLGLVKIRVVSPGYTTRVQLTAEGRAVVEERRLA